MIAPVLASLGVFRSLTKHHRPSSYCHWPGYASRIVFERYSHVKKHSSKASSRSDAPIDAQETASLIAAAKHFWDEHHHARHVLTHVPSSEKSVLAFLRSFFHETTTEVGTATGTLRPWQRVEWVRVVYNGDDITSMIPACLAERWIIAHVLAHHMSTTNEVPSSSSSSSSTSSNVSELATFVASHKQDLLVLARRFFTTSTSSDVLPFTLCSSVGFRHQIEDLIAPSGTLSAACERPVPDYSQAGVSAAAAAATATTTEKA